MAGMTETEGDVVVQIRAEVSRLLDGLKQASAGTEQGAEEMRKSLLGIGEAAEETEGATSHLLEHVRGMRQEMFLGSFMARQITEIGAASKETAGLVAGLAGAFLVGNWTGLVVEGALKIVSAFNEGGSEMKKFTDDAVAGVQKLQEKVDAYLAAMRGATETEKLQHEVIGPLLRQEADEKQAVLAAQTKLSEATDKYNEAITRERATEAGHALDAQTAAEEELEQAKKKLEITQEQIKASNEALKPAQKAETNADRQKALEKAAQDELKLYQKIAAEKQKYDKEEYDYFYKLAVDKLNAEKSLAVAVDKAEAEAAVALQKYGEIRLNSQKEISDHLKAARDAENKEWVDGVKKAVTTIGSALDQNFKALISGTESVTDAFKKMGEAILSSIVDALVKIAEEEVVAALTKKTVTAAANTAATQGNIATAVSGAAASQAGIPFVGPELALGAAGAMLSFLEGVTGPLLAVNGSAAGGWAIPNGINPIVQAHGGEHIIPRDIAQRYEQGAPGGEVHVHIHMDGAGYVDASGVRRLVESNEFQRSVAEAVRNGKWRG